MATASPNNRALERYKSAVTAAASVVGAAMLVRRVISDILPGSALGALLLLSPASARRHVVLIEEFDGALYNRVFLAAKAYVSKLLAAAPSVPLMKASLPRGAGAEHVLLAMRPGTAVVDVFDGAKLTWRLSRKHGGGRRRAAADDAREVFKLSFDAQHKDMVLGSYLPAVMARVEAMSHVRWRRARSSVEPSPTTSRDEDVATTGTSTATARMLHLRQHGAPPAWTSFCSRRRRGGPNGAVPARDAGFFFGDILFLCRVRLGREHGKDGRCAVRPFIQTHGSD